MRKNWWYIGIVIVLIAVVVMYSEYDKTAGIEGLLVKEEDGGLYLLRMEENWDDWGSIRLSASGEKYVDLTKLETGDYVRLRGNISILEVYPLRYVEVDRIVTDRKYDEASLRLVKEAIARTEANGFWVCTPIYPD